MLVTTRIREGEIVAVHLGQRIERVGPNRTTYKLLVAHTRLPEPLGPPGPVLTRVALESLISWKPIPGGQTLVAVMIRGVCLRGESASLVPIGFQNTGREEKALTALNSRFLRPGSWSGFERSVQCK